MPKYHVYYLDEKDSRCGWVEITAKDTKSAMRSALLQMDQNNMLDPSRKRVAVDDDVELLKEKKHETNDRDNYKQYLASFY